MDSADLVAEGKIKSFTTVQAGRRVGWSGLDEITRRKYPCLLGPGTNTSGIEILLFTRDVLCDAGP